MSKLKFRVKNVKVKNATMWAEVMPVGAPGLAFDLMADMLPDSESAFRFTHMWMHNPDDPTADACAVLFKDACVSGRMPKEFYEGMALLQAQHIENRRDGL